MFYTLCCKFIMIHKLFELLTIVCRIVNTNMYTGENLFSVATKVGATGDRCYNSVVAALPLKLSWPVQIRVFPLIADALSHADGAVRSSAHNTSTIRLIGRVILFTVTPLKYAFHLQFPLIIPVLHTLIFYPVWNRAILFYTDSFSCKLSVG